MNTDSTVTLTTSSSSSSSSDRAQDVTTDYAALASIERRCLCLMSYFYFDLIHIELQSECFGAAIGHVRCSPVTTRYDELM